MKPFTRIASVIFGIVAIVHLMRAIFTWSVVLGNEKDVMFFVVPHWISIPAFLLAGFLSVMLWREGK